MLYISLINKLCKMFHIDFICTVTVISILQGIYQADIYTKKLQLETTGQCTPAAPTINDTSTAAFAMLDVSSIYS